MDKKQFKEYVKIIMKIYILLVVMIAIPANIIFSLLSAISKGNFIQIVISNSINLVIASLALVTSVYIVFCLAYFLLKIRRKKESMVTVGYVRELPEYFPPAIASFLLDLNLEITTDYTATIAYLISKKYIELEENEAKALTNNCEKLSLHEKYVFDCITRKIQFNHDEFTKLVMTDAEKMNLIKQGKRKVNFLRNFGLAILMYFVFGILATEVFETGILNGIFSTFSIISAISIFVVIGYSIYLKSKYLNENFHRTYFGENEAKKWFAVKNFLKDYTMISDKSLQDIVIWEDYIPYAIALNEAKTIEKFIGNNEAYRKLIYGNNKQWWNN